MLMLLHLQDYEQRMSSAGLVVDQAAWRPATASELETMNTNSEKSIKVRFGTLGGSNFNMLFDSRRIKGLKSHA